MNFPHWSSRLNFFLCFYYSLIFFYYFPPLLALCMEIRVWIFSSRLPASDCRKEKKKTGNRSLARYYYCDVVCMLVVESYIILFRFFSFSCFVILKLISEWCCGGVECVRNCYAFTTYCCFSSLFLSSSDLKVVLVAHVLLYFSSLLSGKAFWFFPILPHVCKYQDILIWKNLHLCEWWRSEKLSSKRKRCKNIYLSNNTQWTQMRICFAASDWRFLYFGGLFY